MNSDPMPRPIPLVFHVPPEMSWKDVTRCPCDQNPEWCRTHSCYDVPGREGATMVDHSGQIPLEGIEPEPAVIHFPTPSGGWGKALNAGDTLNFTITEDAGGRVRSDDPFLLSRPRYAGHWQIGDSSGLLVSVRRRPSWLARKLCWLLLEWSWVDAQEGERHDNCGN